MKKVDKIINNTSLDNKLREEFINSLKDKDFKKLISTLDLPEDVLMKYTSRLEECSFECSNCSKCSGLLECKNNVRGYVLTPEITKGKKLLFGYVACKYTKLEEYKDNITLFDIPKEIRDASLSSIYTNDVNRVEILKKIKSYYTNYFTETRDKGIYLYGSFGSGKTYIISALMNELAKKDVKSIIVHVPEMLRDLKESLDTDYRDKFSLLKTVPILVLDDIGAEYLTNWTRDEVLEPLLHHRMNENLPTFFTSNLTMEELEKHFVLQNTSIDKINARRIIERIKKLADPVALISKNIRS
ncbi:MAG: primosomal protein DnaI [Bacilli bacterium]|nr:primosomal protein DnaI [Bacilli bacterium]